MTQRIVGVLRRVLHDRAVGVEEVEQARAQVILDLRPGQGVNGFSIESFTGNSNGAVAVTGHDELGLLYGVGKLLRDMRWSEQRVELGPWRGRSIPQCPVRGVYAAFNFQNWYAAAPREELRRYVEELALWGTNAIFFSIHFPTGQDADAERRRLDDARTVFGIVKDYGLQVGLLNCPNVVAGGPPGSEAADFPDTTPASRGLATPRICPSHPQGREYLRKVLSDYLRGYEDIGLDFLANFPYDAGGCGCAKCWPWGCRGFLDLSREFFAMAKDRYPACRTVFTTWCFDSPPAGEWEGLARELARDKSNIDYIMADAHGDFPRYPLDRGVPGDLPLLSFPEITMWGRYAWGGSGANPFPSRLQRLWDQTGGKLSGGFPYSEGIFEDINKTVCTRFYWDASAKASDTVREYVAYEFGATVGEPVVEAIDLLERTLPRGEQKRDEVERAWSLLREADGAMSERARRSWRWRVLYLRGLIDHEHLANQGRLSDASLDAGDELARIYHAQNAGGPVLPKGRLWQERQKAAQPPPPPGSQ